MATRIFSFIIGSLYAFAGIIAFFPLFVWQPDMPRLRMDYLYFHASRLGGFIEENGPHNVLWIIIGVAGILSAATFCTAQKFSQGLFVLATLLVFIGLTPLGVGSLWGFCPLFGWNMILHAMTAMLAWYYGFVYPYGREQGIAQ